MTSKRINRVIPRLIGELQRPLVSQEGVALILVTWVVVLLTIVITEFTFSTKTESTISTNFKEDTQCYYLALAGFNKALAERLNPLVQCVLTGPDGKLIFKQKPSLDKTTGTYDQSHEISEGDLPKRDKLALSQGTYSYDIVDESSKIDLNALARGSDANRNVLKRLLEQGAGMQEGTDMDIIIDSIFDWVDPRKDIHRANGAKDDYYHSLPVPYDCKNGPFYTVEELLLVKGVTPEILYGSDYRPAGKDIDEYGLPLVSGQSGNTSGIIKYLTVWGGGMPNPYTADVATLKIFYGEEAGESMKKNLYSEDGKLLKDCNNSSSTFSITAHGQVGAMSHHIFGVVSFGFKNNTPMVRYLYWNDNYIPPQRQNRSALQASMFSLDGLLKLFVGARSPRPWNG